MTEVADRRRGALVTDARYDASTEALPAVEALRRTTIEQRLLFATAAIGAALFALRINGTVTIPALYLVPVLVLYPISRLLREASGSSLLDASYLLVLFVSVGGLLSFSSTYPVGYTDVQGHIAATQLSVTEGRIEFLPQGSFSFVGLYVVASAVASLTGNTIPDVARVLPLVTFAATLLAFHYGIAQRVMTERQSLLATFLFGTNWGVFRLSIEYRTLNVAFLLVVVAIGLFFNRLKNTHDSTENVLLYVVVIAALTVSHLTTFVFYLLLLGVFTVTTYAHRPRRSLLKQFLISLVLLASYLIYVGGSFESFAITLTAEVTAATASLFTFGGTPTTEPSTKGLVGLTYGYNMFLVEWVLRGLFVLAFGVFFIAWFRRLNRFGTAILLSSIGLGVGVLSATLLSVSINPSRVMTFFAIPYALAYAAGLMYAFTAEPETPNHGPGQPPYPRLLVRALDRLNLFLTGRTLRTVSKVLVVVILVLALTSTVAKFPVDIVGPTEPVRGHNPIDELPYLNIDRPEEVARTFLWTNHDGPVTYLYSTESETMKEFYDEWNPAPVADFERRDEVLVVGTQDPSILQTDPFVASSETFVDRIYDNGEVAIYH